MAEPKWLRDLRKLAPRLVARYQKPKAEGEGERLPDYDPATGDGHFRLDTPTRRVYVKVLSTPVWWWYCDPLGHWGRLEAYRVTEHEDGSITVGGLIANPGPYEHAWCGTLTAGIWKAAE